MIAPLHEADARRAVVPPATPRYVAAQHDVVPEWSEEMVELIPVAEAAGFTAGCLAIHAARNWAETLTPVLTYLVFALAVCLLIVAGIQNASDPDQLVAMMTQAMATY